jgi:hypothetical protein
MHLALSANASSVGHYYLHIFKSVRTTNISATHRASPPARDVKPPASGS